MYGVNRMHDRQQAAEGTSRWLSTGMAGHHEVRLPCRRHQKAVWLSCVKASQRKPGPCCPHTCQLKPGKAYTMSRSRLRLESLSPSSRCRLLDLCVVQRLHRQQHDNQTSNSRRHAVQSLQVYRIAGAGSSKDKRKAASACAFGDYHDQTP